MTLFLAIKYTEREQKNILFSSGNDLGNKHHCYETNIHFCVLIALTLDLSKLLVTVVSHIVETMPALVIILNYVCGFWLLILPLSHFPVYRFSFLVPRTYALIYIVLDFMFSHCAFG